MFLLQKESGFVMINARKQICQSPNSVGSGTQTVSDIEVLISVMYIMQLFSLFGEVISVSI